MRLAIALILTILLLGCSSASEKVEDILPTDTPSSDAPTEDDGATKTAKPTAKPTASRTATPVPTPADIQEVSIKRQGFTNDPDGTSGPSFAVVLKNQSTRSAVESVQLQIAFYDGGGVVLGSQSETISFLQPGEVTAVGGDAYGVSGTATEMRVQVRATDWSTWDDPLITLSAGNISIGEQQYIGPKVTGEITSPFTKDIEFIEVVVVYYDAAGAILAGEFTYVDFIPAGGVAAFDVSHFGSIPGLDHVEVYPQLTSISILGL